MVHFRDIITKLLDTLKFFNSRLKSYIDSINDSLYCFLFCSMWINTHHRFWRPKYAKFCLYTRSIVEVKCICQMTDWKFKFKDLFLCILKEITNKMFTIKLNETVVFLHLFAEVYIQRLRSKTEVNSIVFVQLFDSIWNTLEMQRNLENGFSQ